jgi:hypothetical protein
LPSGDRELGSPLSGHAPQSIKIHHADACVARGGSVPGTPTWSAPTPSALCRPTSTTWPGSASSSARRSGPPFELDAEVAWDHIQASVEDGLDACTRPLAHALPPSALRLVTCGGEFDATTGHDRSDIIVFATIKT